MNSITFVDQALKEIWDPEKLAFDHLEMLPAAYRGVIIRNYKAGRITDYEAVRLLYNAEFRGEDLRL